MTATMGTAKRASAVSFRCSALPESSLYAQLIQRSWRYGNPSELAPGGP
jgi:hypothetical protein